MIAMDTKIERPNIVVICGPTGLGKTAVALELADIFNGEIISADSMQIYRYMDIGTAKPTPCEQARVLHHMIDIVDPDEPFNAMQFVKIARKVITGLCARDVIPFVVGGTGLYIKALVHGLFQAEPAVANARQRLEEEAAVHGAGSLFKRLSQHDPDAAERIHPNDIYRIIRALEIYDATGRTISEYHREHRFTGGEFNVLKIGLYMDRKVLYDRIDRRVDAMIDAGFVDEVKRLLDMGYPADLKSMQAIGYRHMAGFIEGRLLWDKTVQTLKQDTRRYAKRQTTWFQADSEIIWAEPGQLKSISRLIRDFL